MDTKRLEQGLRSGIAKGLGSYIWMLKIIVPISLLTALLSWLGVLQKLSWVLEPLMKYLGLPGIAALPLIAGALSSVYAGIATMSVLPFTKEEMILMANFILICHNMIQETVIQARSGIPGWQAVSVRILGATLTVLALGLFIKAPVSNKDVDLAGLAQGQGFFEMIGSWAISTGLLAIKIFFIIMFILVFLEVAKAMGWIVHIVRATSPFLRIMGLSQRVGFLWMTAVVFGLAYGGAVIVEESKDMKPEELKALQLSIGINHSMVEDPTLFLPLGLPAFWLWVPRLITAILATRLFTLFLRLRPWGIRSI